jgi:hypothetical protein
MSRAGCSPLELDGEPMPIESFHNLYHVPGFKYEYADGRADISVQRSAQATVAAPADRVLERTDPYPEVGSTSIWIPTSTGLTDWILFERNHVG